MKKRRLLLPATTLGLAAMLFGPANTSEGFSLIGDSLSLSQRDFRVYNNFSKAITNDNTTPDDNFPGWDGAEMAIWKACVEWNSELHGTGNGDPTQPGDLGSGGANFDASFQGAASGVGSSGNNIHSQVSGGSGGVLAYAEGGFSGAWRIRYYQTWDWQDGPTSPTLNEIDLQGVACHEYGHALGLGHSNVGGATMFPSISGSGAGQRSIAADDIAGIKAIYGSASSTKPRIFSTQLSGGLLTIQGEDFSGSNNQVWFTNQNTTSTGSNPFVKVTGVTSSGGGTQIVVNVPGNAGPGDVLVQKNSSSNSALSNAWPFDPSGNPPAPTITGLDPSSIPAVLEDVTTVTIEGNGLETVTDVRVGGASVPYTLTGAQALTVSLTTTSGIGSIPVEVDTLFGSGQTTLDVVANDPPGLVNNTPFIVPPQQANLTIGGKPGDTVFLATSLDQIPSVLAGVIASDIGANFSTITLVGAPTIGASGKATVLVNTGGLPAFSLIYFQAAAFDGTFPMTVSSVAQMIVF